MIYLKIIWRFLMLLTIIATSKATIKSQPPEQCTFRAAINYTDAIICGKLPKCCPNSPYRSYDGSCNNLKNPWWAMTGTPFKRLFENNYGDGIHEFPKSEKNKELPNCRETSLIVYSTKPRDGVKWTVLFMQYGQLIAHDITEANGAGGTIAFVECCHEGQYTERSKTDPRCASIKIPKNDVINKGRVCMNFYRSETTNDRNDCINNKEIAEQINTISGYVDASFTYGSEPETAKSLRALKCGCLKSVPKNGMELLPQTPNATDVCNVKKETDRCYIAGDNRVNQNPELAVLQNILLMFHNNVAKQLCAMNPQWDDETIYQETRRIVIGVHQNIAFNELIPFLIGVKTAVEKKITYMDSTDYINDYDANINAAISNEFATAAYRFFHTAIQGSLKKYNKFRELKGYIKLDDWFDNPAIIEEGDNLRRLIYGLTTQAQSAEDSCIVPAVRDYLFKDSQNKGQDLKAKDCHRARDHGLATYKTVYEACCLGTIRSFKDFEKVMDKKVVEKLEKLYRSYKDVDLEVGIALENTLPGALCGAVGACMIAEQFHNSRVGDRYFFENNQNKCSFTRDQLNAIRKITVASLMCIVPDIEQMQPKAFEQISSKNELVSCKTIPQLDLSLWKTTSKKGCAKNECSY